MRHPNLRQLHARWEVLRRGAAAPERTDFDFAPVASAAGDMALIGSREEGRSIRFAGSRLCAALGREVTHLPFATLWRAEHQGEVLALLEAAAEEPRPIVIGAFLEAISGTAPGQGRLPREIAHVEIVLLPFRHEGIFGSRILCGLGIVGTPSLRLGQDRMRLGLVSYRFLGAAERGFELETDFPAPVPLPTAHRAPAVGSPLPISLAARRLELARQLGARTED